MKNLTYLGIFILILSGGCQAHKQENLSLYLINYPEEASTSFHETALPLPHPVTIKPVTVSPAFSTQLIALRKESHRLEYFTRHEWAIRPEESLTAFVNHFYTNNQVFLPSSHTPDISTGHYQIRVQILHLEVAQNQKDFIARLELTCRLENTENGAILLTHQHQSAETIASRNLNLFAQSISLQFFQALDAFTNKTIATLSQQEPLQ